MAEKKRRHPWADCPPAEYPLISPCQTKGHRHLPNLKHIDRPTQSDHFRGIGSLYNFR